MNGVLEEALRAEGLDGDAIVRVDAALTAAELAVTWDRWGAERREKERRERERQATAEAGKAEATPYTGPKINCQQAVHETGRLAVGFNRCGNKARFVRLDRDGERIAVCSTHVKQSSRDLWRHRAKEWIR